MGIIIAISIIYFIIDIIVANYMKNVAYVKGYDDNAHAFALCFWLGVAGWLYVVALPDLVARKNQEEIIELLKNGSKQEIVKLPEL